MRSSTAECVHRPKSPCVLACFQQTEAMSSTTESLSTVPLGERPPNTSIWQLLSIVPEAISRGAGAAPPTSMRFHSRLTVLNTHTSPNALQHGAFHDCGESHCQGAVHLKLLLITWLKNRNVHILLTGTSVNEKAGAIKLAGAMSMPRWWLATAWCHRAPSP